jgi:hypothetical protein
LASVKGKTVVYCSQGRATGERLDFPAKAMVKPSGGGWTLEAVFPWKELGVTPEAGKKLGFSWLVNDSDSGDFDCWVEWTPGVAGTTNPFVYGSLELMK